MKTPTYATSFNHRQHTASLLPFSRSPPTACVILKQISDIISHVVDNR